MDTQDSPATSFGEQTLDEHLEAEQKEIAEIDKANEEPESDGDEDVADEASDEYGEDGGDESDYKANTKFKVLDEEHEFDPKLKSLLTKETEPIIRELYEKAHGIEAIKTSRTQVTRERDEVRGNYDNLISEVGRVLNYKKGGDLQSFFESVQLSDHDIAKYILEKVRINQLPPEQQLVYTEREALRRRMNQMEQNFQTVQTRGNESAIQERLASLDNVLGNVNMKRATEDFDARNGKGAFKEAVMHYAANVHSIQKKDLTPDEAVAGFMKTFGISVPKGPPKPGADATKRVVAKPKVKTIPNYGGGQASVTASQKPKSVEDLRKAYREMTQS